MPNFILFFPKKQKLLSLRARNDLNSGSDLFYSAEDQDGQGGPGDKVEK